MHSPHCWGLLKCKLSALQIHLHRRMQLRKLSSNYGRMWNYTEEKDLPEKVPLKAIHAIRQKALETHDTPQLIAAMLSTYQLEKEISPDSTQKVIEEMELILRC